MRLFLAVTPPETLRRSVTEWARQAGMFLPSARWMPPENLHLTLRFLGAVEEEVLDALVSAVATATRDRRSLSLRLGEPGTLPRRSRARVACVDIEPSEALSTLQSEVAAAAETALGLSPDPRPFFPHLTLARTRRAWPGSASSTWRALSCPCRGESFEVTYVDLMESLLRSTGARYRTVERFPLDG